MPRVTLTWQKKLVLSVRLMSQEKPVLEEQEEQEEQEEKESEEEQEQEEEEEGIEPPTTFPPRAACSLLLH